MRCERCQQAHRLPIRRAKLAEREGHVAIVLGIPMFECSACAERWLDWDVARRLDELFTVMLAGAMDLAVRRFEHVDGPQS